VKVVLADLALTQVSNRPVSSLTTPEYRRLCIGVQLVRDPSMYFLLLTLYPSNHKEVNEMNKSKLMIINFYLEKQEYLQPSLDQIKKYRCKSTCNS